MITKIKVTKNREDVSLVFTRSDSHRSTLSGSGGDIMMLELTLTNEQILNLAAIIKTDAHYITYDLDTLVVNTRKYIANTLEHNAPERTDSLFDLAAIRKEANEIQTILHNLRNFFK